jgi:hypothetical protein
VFTLSGGHITPIYQYLEGSAVALFDTRHEQAAVFMAEAWARMTRKPAVAMVTAGPGFTNALSGIANARLSTPGDLIAGCVGLEAWRSSTSRHEPASVIAPMVKAWFSTMEKGFPSSSTLPSAPPCPDGRDRSTWALRRPQCEGRSGSETAPKPCGVGLWI